MNQVARELGKCGPCLFREATTQELEWVLIEPLTLSATIGISALAPHLNNIRKV